MTITIPDELAKRVLEAPEQGSSADFAAAADLVDKLGQCETKGDMLGLVLGYRKAVRAALLTPKEAT